MRARVERGQRLVEQQQARPHQQRAADRDALALAAGKLAGPPVEQMADVEHARRCASCAAAHHARAAACGGRSRDCCRTVEVRKQPALLEHVADAAAVRRHVDAPRGVEQHRRRRARCGRDPGVTSPAIMLTIEVLPAPDGPNSAVTPPAASNCAASAKSPSRLFDVDARASSLPVEARAGAPREPFRSDQRDQRDHDRDDDQPHGRGVAGRALA